MDSEIHHTAFRISRGKLDIVIKLFDKLGLEVTYQPKGEDWALLKNKNNDTRIQIIEVSKEPLQFEGKEESHIGFISKNPKQALDEIEKFAEINKIKFVKGSWSDLEFWFDLPEIFVDFVVEVMDRRILE